MRRSCPDSLRLSPFIVMKSVSIGEVKTCTPAMRGPIALGIAVGLARRLKPTLRRASVLQSATNALLTLGGVEKSRYENRTGQWRKRARHRRRWRPSRNAIWWPSIDAASAVLIGPIALKGGYP